MPKCSMQNCKNITSRTLKKDGISYFRFRITTKAFGKLLRAIHNRSSESNDNFPKPLQKLSINRPEMPKSMKEMEEKLLKRNKSAPSTSAVVNDAKVEPGSPKRKKKKKSKSPRTEKIEQALTSPVTDKRTEDKDHSQRVQKPDQNNSTSQANSSSNTTDASMTAAKPSTSAEQSTQPNQYNRQEHIPDRSFLSNFQPKIENVRSLANGDDHKQLVNKVPSQKPSTSLLHSPKNSAQLNRHMKEGRRLIPNQKEVEKILYPTKMERNSPIAEQNPSNSIDQTRHLSTRSVEQPSVVTQNESQHDPRVSRTCTGNSRDQTDPLRSIGMNSREIHRTRTNLETSTDLADVDPRNILQNVNNAAATSQQLLSSSNNPPSDIRRSNGHQNSVTHEKYYAQSCVVDPRNVLQNVKNAAATSQQVLSSSHNPPSDIRRSNGHQNPVTHEQYYARSYQNKYLPTNQDNFQQERLQGSTDSNTKYHRPTSQTINMRIPSIRQHSTHLSNPMYQTPEIAQQRQVQPNQLDSQQQPPIKPKNKKQMPSLQGVTKKPPPPNKTNVLNSIRQTTQNNFLLNNPQLQARMSPQSTGDNNVYLPTSRQNIIASETSDGQNTEKPSRLIYQPSRIQHATAHENRYQNLYTQVQLVNQSTQTNSNTKRVHFMDYATGSSVTGSHLNVMENACQTDECMVDETLSPYHAVTSDSDAVSDQEVISDHEMLTDEAPTATTNDVYGTANDPWRGSADRPTAAQNSTSTDHQMHPNIILEQQMLDDFATLFIQMHSIVRCTTDMYNNLKSSFLNTAKIYKNLLGAVEQFNNAISSSNLRPEGEKSTEAKHSKVTASTSSSNQDQHSNDDANKTPKKNNKKLYRLVLPPEYDAYDTRWTLKYRTTNLPGLVELIPQSGVYVSCRELDICQQVSKDCESLARRLLSLVFNKNALSVCSSMSEKAQACNNVGSNIRPDLDDHACSVLINFVLDYGLRRGWNIDLRPILSTLHSEMQEIRLVCGEMVEC